MNRRQELHFPAFTCVLMNVLQRAKPTKDTLKPPPKQWVNSVRTVLRSKARLTGRYWTTVPFCFPTASCFPLGLQHTEQKKECYQLKHGRKWSKPVRSVLKWLHDHHSSSSVSPWKTVRSSSLSKVKKEKNHFNDIGQL